jgi:integrase/recombinase XerD
MFCKELFERFLKEKTFLTGVSPKTIRSYRQAFNAYQRVLSGEDYGTSEEMKLPTKDTLKDFVIGMREAGLSPGACNVYIRSINSFLTWLEENGHCDQLKIKQLPQPKTVVKVFTEKHVQALIKFRPTGKYEWRLYALICLLIDTGARIDEILTCHLPNVDLDNLIVKVRGKGNKERLLPISVEMRKILWVYLSRHKFKVPSDYLFPTRDGNGLEYHNVLRDIKELCGRLGIEGVRLSPHGFRHFFSVTYMKRGGEIYRLSRLLGHTSVRTTEIYLQSMGVETISEGHQSLSALNQVR